MAQFDVLLLGGGGLVIDLQTGLIGLGASRTVAPLRAKGTYTALPTLTPEVHIAGKDWIVRTQELAVIPGAEPHTLVGPLEGERDLLKRALDVLIDGF